jgi:hypothetical protein
MFIRFLIVFLLLAGTGFSQAFNGFVDGYWAYNFNRPGTLTTGYRAFDFNHNQFSLNLAELAVDLKPQPVGFRVDVGFGDAMRTIHLAEPAGTDLYDHLQQAYVSYANRALTVDFGKFVTQHGAEVIETKDNWNYSRSLLFTWAIPYYHFGMRANVAATDKVSLGGFLVNGWNNVKENNADKTFGFQGLFKPGKLVLTTNYMVGDEAVDNEIRHLFDGTAMVEVSPQLSLMANYDYGMDRYLGERMRWQGVALYGRVTPVSWLKVTPRWEWFDDPQGFMTGTPQTMKEFTVSSQFVVNPNMSLWAEYRRDWSDVAVFEGRDAGIRDDQNTMTFGVTYTFSRGTN